MWNTFVTLGNVRRRVSLSTQNIFWINLAVVFWKFEYRMNPNSVSPRNTPRSSLSFVCVDQETLKLVYPLWVQRMYPRYGSLSTFVMKKSSEKAARQAAVAYKYAIAAAAAAEMSAITAKYNKYRMRCKRKECHCAKRDPRCKRRITSWINYDLTYANMPGRHALGLGKHTFSNTREWRKVSGNWLWLLPHALSVLGPSHICID